MNILKKNIVFYPLIAIIATFGVYYGYKVYDNSRTVVVSNDWRTFNDIGTLIDRSDYILVASVYSSKSFEYDEEISTDYFLKVHQDIKGDPNEVKDGFYITIPGGEYNGRKLVVDAGFLTPSEGKKYLFFAMKSGDGHHQLFYQGKYEVDSEDNIIINNNKINLNNIIKEIKDYISDKKTLTTKLSQ